MERAGFEMEKVDSREKMRTEKNRREGDYVWRELVRRRKEEENG
jgi:hypothetical protein